MIGFARLHEQAGPDNSRGDSDTDRHHDDTARDQHCRLSPEHISTSHTVHFHRFSSGLGEWTATRSCAVQTNQDWCPCLGLRLSARPSAAPMATAWDARGPVPACAPDTMDHSWALQGAAAAISRGMAALTSLSEVFTTHRSIRGVRLDLLNHRKGRSDRSAECWLLAAEAVPFDLDDRGTIATDSLTLRQLGRHTATRFGRSASPVI